METTIILIILFSLAIFINVFLKPKKKKKYQKKQSTYKRKQSNYTDIDFYKSLKKKNTEKKRMSKKELKEKGDAYEIHVSKHYERLGYITWMHGLEKGYQDKGIDLFIKKDNEYLFIQCKNWDTWKINDKKIIEYRNKAKKYMLDNPKISRVLIDFEYKIKLIMVTPKDSYTKKAKIYLKENKNVVDYKIIPF